MNNTSDAQWWMKLERTINCKKEENVNLWLCYIYMSVIPDDNIEYIINKILYSYQRYIFNVNVFISLKCE